MKRKWILPLLIVICGLFALAAPIRSQAAVNATGISVPSLKVMTKGTSVTLKATLTPTNATSTVTWKSSNTAVATVTAKGVVKAVKEGSAYITATANGKSAKCLVRVAPKLGWYTAANGNTYFYSYSTGLKLKGLKTISEKKYYFDPSSGVLQKGFRTINGKKYYFHASTGVMQTGLTKASNGYTYYFKTTGGYATGFLTTNSRTYYFNPDNGIMFTGMRQIDGKYYLFSSSGVKLTGLRTAPNGYTYYFLSSGGVAKGFYTISSKRYYFDPSSGILQKSGTRTIDGSVYYLDPSTGVVKTGMLTLNGKTYYFGSDGKRQTGLLTISGKTYYFNTTSGVMSLGTLKVGSLLYHFNPSTGEMMTGKIAATNGYAGNTYYFLPEGGTGTGFITIGSSTYYFIPTAGGKLCTGYRQIDGKHYYFEPSTGAMVTGIRSGTFSDGTSYFRFFDPSTETGIRTGLQYFRGKRYLFSAGGTVMTGFQSIGTKLYYFDPEDYAAKADTEWDYEGVYFMFDSNGIATPVSCVDAPRAKILFWVFSHVGVPYGMGEGQYVCSSYAAAAYAYAGITELSNYTSAGSMSIYARDNARCYMSRDSLGSLQPGDLIFWNKPNATGCGGASVCPYAYEFNGMSCHVHHVAVYIGNGQVAEESEFEGVSHSLIHNCNADNPPTSTVAFGASFIY